MHINNQKDNRTTFKITALILLLGAFVAFGLLTDIVSDTFWPFPTVGIAIVIVIVFLISRSRRGVKKDAITHQEYTKYVRYHPLKNQNSSNEETIITPKEIIENPVYKKQNFCDYCGTKLKEYEDYCINCGKQRDN